jgi:uncharacterized protein YjfI (DUF2170 family)
MSTTIRNNLSALIDHVSDITENNGGFNKYMLLRQQLIPEKSTGITFNDCHKSYGLVPGLNVEWRPYGRSW